MDLSISAIQYLQKTGPWETDLFPHLFVDPLYNLLHTTGFINHIDETLILWSIMNFDG